MKKTLKNIKNTLLDVIFPPLCISCRENIETKKEKELNLCKNCQNKILASPTKDNIEINNTNYIHISTGSYKNKVIRDSIHSLKYNQIKSSLKSIETKLIKPTIQEYIDSFKNKEWIIIPVPIHSSKKRKRGFNQSYLIAERINKILEKYNIKSQIQKGFINKTKKTKSQTKLKKKRRKENLKNAFEINNVKSLKNKNAILVDDVFTTGSTVREIVKTMNNIPYEEIIVFTVAKN